MKNMQEKKINDHCTTETERISDVFLYNFVLHARLAILVWLNLVPWPLGKRGCGLACRNDRKEQSGTCFYASVFLFFFTLLKCTKS